MVSFTPDTGLQLNDDVPSNYIAAYDHDTMA